MCSNNIETVILDTGEFPKRDKIGQRPLADIEDAQDSGSSVFGSGERADPQ